MAVPNVPTGIPLTGQIWRCVLCGTEMLTPGVAHFCGAELRIREIIREELDKRFPHPTREPNEG